jgi:catechol 2,3-dioxygenase-like lactoylglutathione lyase family enzyme
MRAALIASALIAFRLVTADPERLIAFYSGLGFTPQPAVDIGPVEMELLGLRGRGTRYPLRLYGQLLELDCFEHSGHPYPTNVLGPDTRFQHLALATEDARASWVLAKVLGAEPITKGEPVTLPPASGGVTAIKFRDPEGHPLEFLQIPSRNPKPVGRGIFRIDHSAISVSNIEASQEYYASIGLTPYGATVNQGSEQAALDGVDAPIVNVVPMRPRSPGPHLELLGYRHPETIPKWPGRVNDLASSRLVWSAPTNSLFRDPDGHIHQLVRPT